MLRGLASSSPHRVLAASVGVVALTTLGVAGAAERGPTPREFAESLADGVVLAKLWAASCGALLIAWGARGRSRAGSETGARIRLAALISLALFAFAAHYNFFTWRHPGGTHTHEFFHYYVGAKYFPELGYYDLYTCAVVAATEADPEAFGRPHTIRDLRRIEARRQVVPADLAEACRSRFAPGRWQSFRADVRLHASRLGDEAWSRVLIDQGLNASPVWLMVGHPIAEWVPAEPIALARYARFDLLVLAAGFAAVYWGFGPYGFALALLTWSANPLAGYEWVGDSPLRQLWLGALLIGLSALRRRRHALAGIFMAASGLIRLFPILFSVTYAIPRLRAWIRARRPDPGFVRFAVAGTGAGLILIAGSIPVVDRGIDVLSEFNENISSYSALKARNSMGWRAVLSHSPSPPPPRLVDGRLVQSEADRMAQKRALFESRRWLYYAGVIGVLGLLVLATRRVEDWEAACLGFVLVLFLTQAASYYTTCLVTAGLLGTRRPRIAIATLGTLVAWGIGTLLARNSADGFVVASWIGLALAVYTLLEIRRTAPGPPNSAGEGTAANPPTQTGPATGAT